MSSASERYYYKVTYSVYTDVYINVNGSKINMSSVYMYTRIKPTQLFANSRQAQASLDVMIYKFVVFHSSQQLKGYNLPTVQFIGAVNLGSPRNNNPLINSNTSTFMTSTPKPVTSVPQPTLEDVNGVLFLHTDEMFQNRPLFETQLMKTPNEKGDLFFALVNAAIVSNRKFEKERQSTLPPGSRYVATFHTENDAVRALNAVYEAVFSVVSVVPVD